ncbi:unnamed protein product [Schistosoma margrebowiei]|uniref:Uncharacterized protein n=1 Tax=Schistosoma margrebowiei TaxID=48269 RepID=A0A183N6A0_9TREM|nr:unnamed protein product [Schistosoma margrebowiei]
MSRLKFVLFAHRLLSPTYIVDRTLQIPVHLFVNKINVFSTQIKRFAGHAHWQNVKHIKEAGDREKSQTALYYVKAAQKAIRADKFFDHIGLVTVSAKSSKQLSDLDAATNLGIEIGAKEVELSSSEDQNYHFHCEVHEIDHLRQSLETIHHIPVINTQDIYSPKIFVPIHHDVRQTLDEMYDKIKTSLEYVDRIFDNVIINK